MGHENWSGRQGQTARTETVVVADGGSDEIRAEWDRSDPDSIPSAVVRAVGEAADLDPLEMTDVLNSVVDADALSALLTTESADGDVSVTFPLEGQVVTVRDNGIITVEGAEESDFETY